MNNPKLTNYTFYIKGLWRIHFGSFCDNRGVNFEGINEKHLSQIPELNRHYSVDSFSRSKKWVLRGFHGDIENYKIVQCLEGKIQLVFIDIRKESPTYNKVLDIGITSSEHYECFIIPPGVVNAHLCISENCLFFYKLSNGYVPIEKQLHVKWDNSFYNINWMGDKKDFILSERDK